MDPSPALRAQVRDMLLGLLHIPSVRGQEGPANRFLREQMRPLVDQCELAPISDQIMQDPDYAFPLPGHTYLDTPNLECRIRGEGGKTGG